MNIRAIIDHIFPTRCLLCAGPSVRRPNLCPGCERDLPRQTAAACSLCARPATGTGACGECLRRPPPFGGTRAALLYRGAAPALVHLFKFRGNLAAGRVLSSLLAEAVDDCARPDVLIPVPSSTHRRRQRGFDPGVEIARGVARATGLPLDRRAASRRVHRPPQSSLPDWPRRYANVRDVFHVEPRRVAGRAIVLVDDVMTSGATVTALARELRGAGAREVQVWVACRAVPPGAAG